MHEDVYQYLQWLQMTIQAQEKRIASLETTIQKMKEDMKQLEERKSIHVEKIEYKFDQLKVETLDGTLNIGLNPSELAGIEDLAVQNQSLNTPIAPKAQMKRSMKIEEAIYQYLESDLPRIIEDAQKKLNMQPSDAYLSFIKEDIIKQLPNRVEHHLNVQSRSTQDPQLKDEQIIDLLKQEIQNGVFVFLKHLPENVKGMKKDEL